MDSKSTVPVQYQYFVPVQSRYLVHLSELILELCHSLIL